MLPGQMATKTNLPSLTDEPTLYPGCCFSLSRPLLGTIHSLLLQSIDVRDSHSSSSTSSTAGVHQEGKSRGSSGDDDDDDDDDEEEEEGGGEDEDDGEEESLVLSIGSGTGLLEELLHRYMNDGARDQSDGAEFSSVVTDATTTAAADASGDGVSNAGGNGGNDDGKPWRVEGVEVNPTVNLHLPEDRINHVSGTWAVLDSRHARRASALMFVYPRDGALVRRYVDAFFLDMKEEGGVGGGGGGVRLVLWLGPKCDWEETGFGNVGGVVGGEEEFEIVEMSGGRGIAEFEMLAALRRRTI